MNEENNNRKKDILSMPLEALSQDFEALGEKKFRAKQVFEWLHSKLVFSFMEMTNLSLTLRQLLEERYEINAVKSIKVQESKLDGTRKYLFELSDQNVIESVWMKYKHGNSVCISSQVGCRMGCRFCASTIDGLERNLTAGEMLAQIYEITKLTNERVSNVVIMGSGEPLDNYEQLLLFLSLITSPDGLCISQRNITVSTCGLVPNMIKLADEKLQITLALSLHAATDEKRKKLMPIANRYSIGQLMEACEYYFSQTGRRLTFEYSLVGGVNDTDEDARELSALLKNMNCHVNLIPVNPVKERDYIESEHKDVINFKNKLEKNRINVTIRREMGRDIDGACGQLRRSYITSNNDRREQIC
ncbi:MAG: 23S rRNA (adenine(2503)-C(2))-methyltransferase RlmN [Clostridia bacterium]|nr:23S rRNA (adenine(2503)-C(2))-methyltransferase RlmN [Clostridia bacterium]